jgi:hypothetical protein
MLDKITYNFINFRDNDFITTEQADMIRERMRDLCQDLGESSIRIIDAIANPDHLIGSALGHSDGQVYHNFINAMDSNPGCYHDDKFTPAVNALRSGLPEPKL